ncbi:hypothetical protein R50073_30330 [Maricurvus nonylphenolicus]|uniref:RHS repeat-associated core domain-containing protein n=1 Tax=Maricurvus nonylphenolicus TaxID=1008307 RepID=UPI0036F27A52
MDSLHVKDNKGSDYLITKEKPKRLTANNRPLPMASMDDIGHFLDLLTPQARTQLNHALDNKPRHEIVNTLKGYDIYAISKSEKQSLDSESKTARAANGKSQQDNSAGNSDNLQNHVTGTETPTTTAYPHSEKSTKTSNSSATTEDPDNQVGTSPATGDPSPSNSDTPCEGEPISMISGEELLELTDFNLPGPIPFAWKRTYRTSNPTNLGLGHGWSHPLSERLVIEGNTVDYLTLEGRSIRFTQPSIGETRHNRSEDLALLRQSEFSYTLMSPTDASRIFRADGIHKHLPLVELRDSFNNSINIDYQQGQPRKLVTSWGRLLDFDCDEQGQITAIKAPQLQDGPHSNALLAQYHYDDHNDMVSATLPGGQTEAYQYNNHIIVQRTTSSGVNYLFEWDKHTPEARCQRQWSDGASETGGAYDYRFKWQPKRKISYATDSNGKTREYHYDAKGNVVKEVDPEGGVTKRLYDSYGKLCSETNPNGHTTYYRYNSLGKVTRITNALNQTTRIRYNTLGLPALITDPLGNHWQRRYNTSGLLTETRDPAGNAWRYSYNDKGQLETIEDPEGGKRQLQWNSQFELISETDPDGRTTQYSYDTWGRVQRITNAAGHAAEYRYDVAGRPVEIIDHQGLSTHLQYNASGQVTHHINAQGQTTEYQYGGFAQVETRIDGNGQRLEYLYDQERNLTGLINEKGERYTLKYDGNERLIEEIGFDGRHQHYRYNSAGQLTEHRDMDVVTHFNRDATGRLLRKTNNNGDLAEFHYDALGRMTSANNGDAFIRYQYDSAGRLIAEHVDSANAENQEDRSHSLQHKYDKRGWRISTSSDDQHISYQHTPGGQLYGVDHNGNPVVRCEYDETGRLREKIQGQLSSQFDYDPNGRLVQQQVSHKGDDNPVIQRDYKYNNAGNLQQVEDLLRGLTQYHYDNNDQLQQVKGPIEEAFNFDPAGNLLQNDQGNAGYEQGNRLQFHGDRHFSYDKRGNLIEEKHGKGQQLSASYQYNGWNQLITVEKNGFKTLYRYDALGRRIGKTVTHLKSKQQKKTTFCWNGDVLWSETNHTPKGKISQHYLFEPNSFRPLALIKDGEIHHYHLDHLGTPQEITDAAGEIVWQAQYKAYGQIAGFSEKPKISNPLRFQGQYFDSETGLHYNRHRYYDPGVGRFVHQDPVGLLGGNNCYQYAPNPTGWVDPLGLTCKEGHAVLRLFDNGYQEGHLTIEVVLGDLSYATHQIITAKDKSQTTIVRAGRYNTQNQVAQETKIPLPNASVAIEYQKSLINEELGEYDIIDNSCYSHVFDVLEEGGHNPISRSKIGFAKFMKKNDFTKIESNKSLETEM